MLAHKKRIISILLTLVMVFSMTVTANADTDCEYSKILYKCKKYSDEKIMDIISSNDLQKIDTNIHNDFKINGTSEAQLHKLGSVNQILEIIENKDGSIDKIGEVTTVYSIDLNDNLHNTNLSPYSAGTDVTSSITMYLTSNYTITQFDGAPHGRITDFSVHYIKSDPQAIVSKISLNENSYGHTFSKNFATYYGVSKNTKSLGNIINPSNRTVYTISNAGGSSSLSNRQISLVAFASAFPIGYAGTKAVFSIKRNNSSSAWTAEIASNIYLDGESNLY